MARHFGILQQASKYERLGTFNPEEPPPHGDWPYLPSNDLENREADFIMAGFGILLTFALAACIGIGLYVLSMVIW